MNEGIKEIYRHHHDTGERFGRSVLETKRGAFLKEKVGKNKAVLDIGCRDGTLTKYFVKGNKVIGLDIDDKALGIAKSNLGIETKETDLNGDWGLQEHSFDVVVAGEIIEHLYFPAEVLKKIKKVLKEEGVLLGSVPNAFSLQNRFRLLFGNKRATPLNDPTHINHFSYKELKSLLLKYFDEVEIYPEGNYAWLDKIFPGWFSFMMYFVAKKPKHN